MIKKSVNIKCFKSVLMRSFSLQERSLFLVDDTTGAKLLMRLRLKLSHLHRYKFCRNWKGTESLYVTAE